MFKNIIYLLLVLPTLLLAIPQYIFPMDDAMTIIESWDVYKESPLSASLDTSLSPLYTIGNTEIWQEFPTQQTSTLWYHQELVFPERLTDNKSITIYIPVLLTSYNVYWDSELVGNSGNSDQTSYGKSGQIFNLTTLQSSPGQHRITLEVTHQRNISGALPEPVYIGESNNLVHTLFKQQGLSVFLAGIFAITALFYLFIVGSRRQRNSHILFSLFSLSCGGHILVSMFIEFGEISLNNYYSMAIAGDIFWFGMLTMLPIYLLSHFNAQGKKYTAAIIFVCSLLIVLLPRLALYNIIPIRFLPALHELNLIYAYVSVAASIGVVIGSVHRKRKGSKTILVGMLIFLVGLTITTLFGVSNGWAIGFASLNIFITIAISRQLSDERKQYYQSELKSSRLELELLKKHIQPHFLLNSLNSIIAWIEEEPAVAGKLVNALSRELRMMMAYAGEKVINISQEIKMCQTHLAVMSMRQEKEFTLIVNGQKEGFDIPPFIIHTLLENGISHGFKKKEEGTFTLTISKSVSNISIILHNNGNNKNSNKNKKPGTGLRYIRSRLRETYGTNYSFQTAAVENGWESRIEIQTEDR